MAGSNPAEVCESTRNGAEAQGLVGFLGHRGQWLPDLADQRTEPRGKRIERVEVETVERRYVAREHRAQLGLGIALEHDAQRLSRERIRPLVMGVVVAPHEAAR